MYTENIQGLECPICGNRHCRFDELQFVCDDCGYAWSARCTCPACQD